MLFTRTKYCDISAATSNEYVSELGGIISFPKQMVTQKRCRYIANSHLKKDSKLAPLFKLQEKQKKYIDL